MFRDTKLIIFDLDGTLIDSVPDLAAAVNATLKHLGRELFGSDQIRSWVGNGAATLIRRALSASAQIDPNLDPHVADAALEYFLDYYRKHLCDHTLVYEGVHSTLLQLQKEGFKMGIVTNKPDAFVAPILKTLELEPYFALSLGADALSRQKPDPLPLRHLCEHFDVGVDQAVMVGDSKNDILAAKAAKMPSIAVSYGYNYEEPISVHQPDQIIAHFGSLYDLLVRRR